MNLYLPSLIVGCDPHRSILPRSKPVQAALPWLRSLQHLQVEGLEIWLVPVLTGEKPSMGNGCLRWFLKPWVMVVLKWWVYYSYYKWMVSMVVKYGG